MLFEDDYERELNTVKEMTDKLVSGEEEFLIWMDLVGNTSKTLASKYFPVIIESFMRVN